MPSLLAARFLIIAAVALMSLGGLGIKMCSLGPWEVAGFRSGFAALTVFLLLREARRKWNWKILGVGAVFGSTLVLYVWGNKTTTAANTIFIQSSAPLWVLLFSPFMLKEAIRMRDVITMLVMGAGLGLFFLVPEKETVLSPDIVTGNWLALGAGITFGFTILGLRWLRGNGAEAAVVCGNSLVFLTCLIPQAALGEGAFAGRLPGTFWDWLLVAGLGSLQLGAAYIFYTRGLRVLRAVQVSLIGLIEPVFNPLWVFLVFREERPGLYALIGGAVILGAAVYQTVSHRRRD
jgi:DME family drug/metabolite transporter